jgi:hypothetical protein
VLRRKRTRTATPREKDKTYTTAYIFEGKLHFLCSRVTRHQYRHPENTECASRSCAPSCLACSTRLLRVRTVASLASAAIHLIKVAHIPPLSKSAFKTHKDARIHSTVIHAKSKHHITHIALKLASNIIRYSACLCALSEFQSDGSPCPHHRTPVVRCRVSFDVSHPWKSYRVTPANMGFNVSSAYIPEIRCSCVIQRHHSIGKHRTLLDRHSHRSQSDHWLTHFNFFGGRIKNFCSFVEQKQIKC